MKDIFLMFILIAIVVFLAYSAEKCASWVPIGNLPLKCLNNK